ncbi:MAG: P-loop NTPase [Clostridia bacterium]|nr:P-loop NTPase [Clostridia bacterium]
MSLCLAIVSGKGGTGKSTVSSGLSIAFSRNNKKVLLVDLDMGLRCIDTFFGIEEGVVFDLYDAISSGNYESAFYYPENEFDNICIVPAPPKNKPVTAEQFSSFYDFCNERFDVIILDLPAGLDFSLLENVKDRLTFICVSNPDPISVKDASCVAQTLYENGIKNPKLIINKFDAELIICKTYKNIDSVIDLSGIRLLGIIPNSPDLMLLPLNHKLRKKSKAYKALNRISRRLSGETVLLPKPKRI